jgi:hypothetical protein
MKQMFKSIWDSSTAKTTVIQMGQAKKKKMVKPARKKGVATKKCTQANV